ncbi:matrix metalloproteinase-21-like [Saccoglossus kowalevskii]
MWRTFSLLKITIVCCVCFLLVTRTVWAHQPGSRRLLNVIRGDDGVEQAEELLISLSAAEMYMQSYGYMPKYNEDNGLWEYIDWDSPAMRPSKVESISPSILKTIFKNTVAPNTVPMKESFDDTLNRIEKHDFSLPKENKYFEQGLIEFQRRNNLKVTGKLDERTATMMRKPRCGVPDNEQLIILGKHSDDGDENTTATTTTTLTSEFGSDNSTLNGTSIFSTSVSNRTYIEDDEFTTNSTEYNITDVNTTIGYNTTFTNGTTAANVSTVSTTATTTTANTTDTTPTPGSNDSHQMDIQKPSRRKRYVRRFHSAGREKRGTSDSSSNNEDRHTISLINKPVLVWRLGQDEAGYEPTRGLSFQERREVIYTAFRIFDEVLPIDFIESVSGQGDVNDVDILITFNGAGIPHSTCQVVFYFYDNAISHSWTLTQGSTGEIHFNGEFTFLKLGQMANMNQYHPFGPRGPVHLLSVAVHEIGHVLGLPHVDESERISVMNHVYHGWTMSDSSSGELSREDRDAIQDLYGECQVQIDTAFDFIHIGSRGQVVFTTYLFQDRHHWVYFNSGDRPSYGYPKPNSNSDWAGILDDVNNLDAAVQLFITGTTNQTYFFHGTTYTNYTGSTVTTRRISDGFPSLPGSSHSIPNNVDAAYFDFSDNAIYFFKAQMVYAFDVARWGCCKPAPKTGRILNAYRYSLPPSIDVAYPSLSSSSVFFVKGLDVFESTWNPFLTSSGNVPHSVVPVGKFHNNWRDVCNVGELSMQGSVV